MNLSGSEMLEITIIVLHTVIYFSRDLAHVDVVDCTIATPAADIYSLGLLAFFVVTFCKPFEGIDKDELKEHAKQCRALPCFKAIVYCGGLLKGRRGI